MELKDFIKTAVSDITNAIAELQANLGNGAVVNPALQHSDTDITIEGSPRHIERINFDIAVSTSQTSAVSGDAKGGITIISAKIESESSNSDQNSSRLSFSIPLLFPAAPVRTDRDKATQEAACRHRQKYHEMRDDVYSGEEEASVDGDTHSAV